MRRRVSGGQECLTNQGMQRVTGALRGQETATPKWTTKMVSDRLEEAVKTLQALRVSGTKPKGYASSWPDVLQDPSESYGWNDSELRPIPPSPDAITRMDQTLLWLHWLEPDHARLVWLHAARVPRKAIMSKFSVGRTTAWTLWMTALQTIATMLNHGGNIGVKSNACA
ncbi:MAG: DUF6362 family protein [Magnetococcus sp. YQC-3]